MSKVLVLNGPNLNLLGQREPEVYGDQSLEQIVEQLSAFAMSCDWQLEHLQSNAEHELVTAIQQAPEQGFDYIIFNPAAFTHTSVALRDALLAVELPFVEVHLSVPQARDDFRQTSYFSDIAVGIVSGFGGESYLLALQAIINRQSAE